MNLIIDVGNTFVKFAIFQKNRILKKEDTRHENVLETFDAILQENISIEKGIICSVGKLDDTIFKIMASKLEMLVLNHEVHIPFKNLYATPRTLGVDRIALVSASVQQFPSSNVLIIDAGTCITYDFVTQNNDYLGGAISPGIRMRYTALNNLTANLPLLDIEMPNQLIGNSTMSSIHSGVVFGVLKEIDGMIDEYREEYEDLTVILTGGDANFLSKQLKNSIFANSNFLLEGLNFILEFNSH
ncbi:type III pantothenate kinase [Subsaxibacter sp. CAU 1640]|uniref:type III pantothenate kinase n=1 Tax=Subsaxibacter sp. CAU 1640 TaxID=2933271 RepID=UPI0020060119|nr:type III pantothenate kinase [Subsaxibacter sp. CAU 1640]MCK7589002.1 type III pantothenate kinase [Subsaxibacter sp. CAU 1640]